MSFAKLKEYIDFIFVKVPEKYKEEFRQENNSVNISRVRNISFVVLVISAMTIIFRTFYENSTSTVLTPHATAMHVILMFIVYIFIVLTSKFEKKNQYNVKFCCMIGKLYTICCLVWGMAFSIDAQSSNGQITVYVLAITLVALPFYIEPVLMAVVYLFVNSVFCIILPYFQEASNIVLSHQINSVYLISVAWFISRLLYKNKLNDFIQKKMIREKNIELSELNIKLEQLACTDSLTGIYNRREFDTILELEWQKSFRDKSFLSIALIDIDFFKSYNDNLGHIAGDDCIKTVVNTISSRLKRTTDYIARFGGDEFILILSNTDQNGATYICDSIREAVEALQMPHPNSPMACVTISVGICTMIATETFSFEYIVNNSDKALYHAKYNGRNQVFSIKA